MEKPNRVATAGQLRAALEGIPDDTRLLATAVYPGEPGFVDERVIRFADRGEGHGLEPDTLFTLECHIAMRGDNRWRTQPLRQAAAEAFPAEPEAEP